MNIPSIPQIIVDQPLDSKQSLRALSQEIDLQETDSGEEAGEFMTMLIAPDIELKEVDSQEFLKGKKADEVETSISLLQQREENEILDNTIVDPSLLTIQEVIREDDNKDYQEKMVHPEGSENSSHHKSQEVIFNLLEKREASLKDKPKNDNVSFDNSAREYENNLASEEVIVTKKENNLSEGLGKTALQNNSHFTIDSVDIQDAVLEATQTNSETMEGDSFLNSQDMMPYILVSNDVSGSSVSDSLGALDLSGLSEKVQSQVVHAITHDIQTIESTGEKQLEIQLNPEFLGKVDVKISTNEKGEIKTDIMVERPEVLEMLSKDTRILHEALKEISPNDQEIEINLNLSQKGQSQTQEEQKERMEEKEWNFSTDTDNKKKNTYYERPLGRSHRRNPSTTISVQA